MRKGRKTARKLANKPLKAIFKAAPDNHAPNSRAKLLKTPPVYRPGPKTDDRAEAIAVVKKALGQGVGTTLQKRTRKMN